MEHEAGPESVFATWRALAKASRNAGRKYVMDALNKQLDVVDNFPEFVMRMYNANALQGDPIRPRFVDLDSNFPDGTTPDWKSRTLGDDPLEVDYHRQTINDHGDGQKVCVKDELILVLANQPMDEDDFVEGSAQLERVKDEHDKDKRCGQVETNNPETLTRLAKSGDVVKVSGTEGDGEADSVPVVVMITDPENRQSD